MRIADSSFPRIPVRIELVELSVAAFAELNDPPPIALGGPAFRSGAIEHPGLSLLGQFDASFAARVRFAVEVAGYGCGSPNFTQRQDFDFEFTALGFDSQELTYPNCVGGLRGLVVGLNPAEFTRSTGEGTGFEEAGCPEPFVEANVCHT
jgi:hypothetical protein